MGFVGVVGSGKAPFAFLLSGLRVQVFGGL